MFKKLMVAGAIAIIIFMMTPKGHALNLGVDTKTVSFKGFYLGCSMIRDYKDALGHVKVSDISFDAGLGFDIKSFQFFLTPIKLNLGTGNTHYSYELALKAFFK